MPVGPFGWAAGPDVRGPPARSGRCVANRRPAPGAGAVTRPLYTLVTMMVTGSGRTLAAAILLGTLALACSPAAAPSTSTAPTPSTAASPGASTGAIVLQRTGPVGCDSIGIDYTSATIRIDAASDPDVWAETEAGKKLAVNWTDGFTAKDGPPPVILGPKGEEVAKDGTRIDVPAAAYPRLAGYFVCLEVGAIDVLESDPQ